jgi:hypothetical protein
MPRITITYRLGAKEEVSVTAVLQELQELQDEDHVDHEACALLGSVRTSSMPIWPEGAGAARYQ